MQFDREGAGGAFFKFERFETSETQERHTLTLGLYHISMSQLEWFSQYMIFSLSRGTRQECNVYNNNMPRPINLWDCEKAINITYFECMCLCACACVHIFALVLRHENRMLSTPYYIPIFGLSSRTVFFNIIP